MKIAVIGINGLAGSAFSRVLPKMGHECIGISRDNYDTMAGSEVDLLINANGNSSKPKAESDYEGEIERTVNSTARFCSDFNFNCFIQISSGDVYNSLDNPTLNSEDTPITEENLSAYGKCKHMAECAVQNKCDNWLILRPGGLIGPGLKKNPIYDLLTDNRLFVHPDSRFSYIHTDVLAETIVTLIDKGISNETFNIAGKGLISIKQVMGWTDNLDASYDDSSTPLHYELSIDKIEKHCIMPETETTVRNFIDSWKAENTNA